MNGYGLGDPLTFLPESNFYLTDRIALRRSFACYMFALR